MPRNQKLGWLVVAVLVSWVADSLAPAGTDDGPGVIATMDEVRFQPPQQKGTLERVDGQVRGAIRFRFEAEATSTFFTSNVRGTPEWDRADGFSFWVRGAGGSGFAGLQFIYDDDYAVRYDLCFPVVDGRWTRVVVRWSDLIPVLPGPRARALGTPDGNRPSRLSGLWIGRWWYWGHYPALAFDVDDIRLESSIERAPPATRPEGPPLARVLAKLRAGQPVTVVTLGDSLTDKRHWANRDLAWVDRLRDQLQTDYRSRVTLVNPAIGGTQLRQNLVLMPRWLAEVPEPDLVTICFGGNDREAGLRGPEFEQACAEAIERIRRATRGHADVLLMTTNPSAARWGETDELTEACRRAAAAGRAGLADTAAAFRTEGADNPDRLFVDDRVHLSRAGHELVARVVLQAIAAGGVTPAPAAAVGATRPRIRVSRDRTHFVRDGADSRSLRLGPEV